VLDLLISKLKNMKLKLKYGKKNAQDKEQWSIIKSMELSLICHFEMLDVFNEDLSNKGGQPVSFDHDCREGICGMCSLYINGEAHGPDRGVTTCQLHMRMFNDGDTITIEPFRAGAFPVVKDLVVDRSAFDRIQHAGGFISVVILQVIPDANAIPTKKDADSALMQRLVLVVVLVWLLVRTLQRCCLWRQSIPVRYLKVELKRLIAC
jgi:succinate dehydrogenase / fumarate reductase iron-sulfur subunit